MKTLNRAFRMSLSFVVVACGVWIGWNANKLFGFQSDQDNYFPARNIGNHGQIGVEQNTSENPSRHKWPKARYAALIPLKPAPIAPEELMAEENEIAQAADLSAEQVEKLNQIAHRADLPTVNRTKALRILHSKLANEGWQLISSDIEPELLANLETTSEILADEKAESVQ